MIRSLLIALVFVSNEGFAFELSKTSAGAEVHWDPPSFAYGASFTRGDEAEERFAAACRAAADRWVIGSRLGLDARWSGRHDAAEENDDRNTIDVVTEWDETYGETDLTVAHTELRYRVDDGVILEGDIILNGEAFAFDGDDGFDAESVVLHELGHFLGIGHSCGDPGSTHPSCFSIPEAERTRILEAVMAPALAPGVKRRELGVDDLEALSVHYPGTAAGDPPGPVVLERACPDGDLTATPQLEATLRFSTGEVAPLMSFEGAADLIVRDPKSGLFSVLYLVEPPPPCGADPDPTGCGCAAGRQGTGNGAMLWLMVAAAIMARRRWSWWCLPALLMLLPGDAYAFKCSRVGAGFGPSLIWQTRTIPWYADAALFDVYGDPISAEEDARAAFLAWEEVPCSDITLPLAAIIPNLRAEYLETGDNKNVVVALKTAWPHDRGALAVTTSAYDVRTGVVVDTDMEINAEHFVFARVDDSCAPDDGTMDLRNTITHEVGHIIGLDHPPSTPAYRETTMFASAPPCETKKRTLEADDIEGICSIYPAGSPSRQCYLPDGPSFAQVDSDDGFGCRSVNGKGASFWLLLGILFFALSRVRRSAPR